MNKLIILLFTITSSISYAAPGDIPDLIPRWLETPSTTDLTWDPAKESFLEKVTTEDLPSMIPDGTLSRFKAALEKQIVRCEKLNRIRPNTRWRFGDRVVNREQWCNQTNHAFLELVNKSTSFSDFWEEAKTKFEWYRSKGVKNDGKVKFTGYYLPLLRGSRTRTPRFTYPVYKRPPNLVRVVIDGKKRYRKLNPDGTYSLFHDRKEIDWDGVLEGKGLEIAYVDDPIEAFFLHIQGSGSLHLLQEDGSYKRSQINFGGGNGRKYLAIGRFLRNEGVDPKYSTLQGLRRYFRERPHEIDRVFPLNQSYIFFGESEKGPYGSGGTILEDGHSIATDNKLFPLGAVSLFNVTRPEVAHGEIVRWIPFSRFAVNQDTGGAIKGPSRVDIFWGEGEYAEIAAGHQNHIGGLFFALLPENKEN